MEISESWSTAKSLISSGATFEEITDAVTKLSKAEIENVHQDNHNLLHLAISNNRVDVVGFLVENFFQSPYHSNPQFHVIWHLAYHVPPVQQTPIPYLHMACVLDRSECIRQFLGKTGDRMFDLLELKVETDNQHWKKFIEDHPIQDIENEELHEKVKSLLSSKTSLTVFEVAALYQRKECLQKILMSYPKDERLGKMIESDQPSVVHTILETMEVDPNAVDYGFEMSLVKKLPICLRMIVQYAESKNITFLRKNPFYFMYRYGVTQGNTLAECTKILLDHGWDVNVMIRPASYALYQFFEYHQRSHHGLSYRKVSMDDKFACLSLLLEAGADPNFNEESVEFDEKFSLNSSTNPYGFLTCFEYDLMCDNADMMPVNREPQRSAALGLANMFYPELDEEVFRFIMKAVPLLDKYGCDMSYIHSNGDTMMHRALSGLAVSIGHLNIQEHEIPVMTTAISALLSYGANMNLENKNKVLPLSKFTERLLIGLMSVSNEFVNSVGEFWERIRRSVTPVYKLMLVMDRDACSEVSENSCQEIDNEPEVIPQTIKMELKQLIQSYYSQVTKRSLYETNLVKVWQYIGRKVANVERLELTHSVNQDLAMLFTSYLNGHSIDS